jgi:hypothetical protein
VANAIGIIFGVVAGRRIPERSIKWGAAVIFIIFGVYGLYEYLPRHVWTPPVVAGGIALLAASIYVVARLSRTRGLGEETKEASWNG